MALKGFEILSDKLNNFNSISLNELDKMQLLRRFDTKFILNLEIFSNIVEPLSRYYNILEINNNKIFHYENLYFDTHIYKLFNDHINGKLNRYKIRYRKYLENGDCYFEIKRRNNKKYTIKYRRKSNFSFVIEGIEYDFLKRYIDYSNLKFLPKLFISYQRITLQHKSEEEKVTFDTNIFFRNTNSELHLPELVIAEVKNLRINNRFEIYDLLRQEQIQPLRISKYCTGTILTNNQLKYNRYKPKFKLIDKLCGSYDGQHHF